jgi:hypothetical protein
MFTLYKPTKPPAMISHSKLQALFDAALSAAEVPEKKHNVAPTVDQASPETDMYARSGDRMSLGGESVPPRQALSLAPGYWKTAM